jgi:hypothetical protein
MARWQSETRYDQHKVAPFFVQNETLFSSCIVQLRFVKLRPMPCVMCYSTAAFTSFFFYDTLYQLNEPVSSPPRNKKEFLSVYYGTGSVFTERKYNISSTLIIRGSCQKSRIPNYHAKLWVGPHEMTTRFPVKVKNSALFHLAQSFSKRYTRYDVLIARYIKN